MARILFVSDTDLIYDEVAFSPKEQDLLFKEGECRFQIIRLTQIRNPLQVSLGFTAVPFLAHRLANRNMS